MISFGVFVLQIQTDGDIVENIQTFQDIEFLEDKPDLGISVSMEVFRGKIRGGNVVNQQVSRIILVDSPNNI